MSAITMPRHEAARWMICFAVVLFAHVGAALALLRVSEEPDFGVDAPVVTLDLPESLMTSLTQPTDLAPGPKEEEDTEPTPPPKEETRPPEPESDVVLPEPPKPQPPREERQATAPPAAKAFPSLLIRWESALAAHIERFKRYPADARARDEQGVVRVAFTIDRAGHVLSSRIVQSSGSPSLDRETLAMLERAQPLPPPPPNIPSTELSFVVPVRFNIQ